MKKLSVIVPIYNAETTLRKCIGSLLSQQYQNLEIVLIDDGSIDGSLAICNEYAKNNDRVIVYHKENAGLVAARKNGVDLATGEYIGFVDSDDYVDADMYSSLMADANERDADIVVGGIVLEYPDHSALSFNRLPAGYYDKTAIEKKIFPEILMKNGFHRFGIIPGVVVKVFKKEIIRKVKAVHVDQVYKISDFGILGI